MTTYPNTWKLFSQSQVQEKLGGTALVDNNNYFYFYPSTYRILEAWIHQLSYALCKQYVCSSFCWELKRTHSKFNKFFKAMSWIGWTAELKPWRFKFWQLQISMQRQVSASVREYCCLQPAVMYFYHPGSTTSGGQRLTHSLPAWITSVTMYWSQALQ